MEKYLTDSNHFLTAERGLRFPNRFPDGILEIAGRASTHQEEGGGGGGAEMPLLILFYFLLKFYIMPLFDIIQGVLFPDKRVRVIKISICIDIVKNQGCLSCIFLKG